MVEIKLLRFIAVTLLMFCFIQEFAGNECEASALDCKNNNESQTLIEDKNQNEETEDENREIDINEAYEKIYKSLKLEKLNSINDIVGEKKKIDIKRLLEGIISGDGEYIIKLFLTQLRQGLVEDVVKNKRLMIELLVIVLIGSVFVNISNTFGQSFISENGFYVTYIIMTAIMLSAFSITMDMVSSTLNTILNLIRVIVPVYALAMNYVGHTTQASGMYQIVLIGVWLVQVIIIRFILPMIKYYVIISMINNLNKEDNFSKLCQLIKSIVSWLLKTIVFFVAGLNLIKSLIEPQIDALGRNMVSRVSAAIPGGGVMSVLTGTFLGAGMVIKNTVGVLFIIVLGIAVLIPIVKVILIILAVKITGAFIQPIGDKRYVYGIEALSRGMGLMLQVLGSSVVMFVLTVAIVAFAGGT